MSLCCDLQYSLRARNIKKLYLPLLVRGVRCKVAKVRLGDSAKEKLYRLGRGDVK